MLTTTRFTLLAAAGLLVVQGCEDRAQPPAPAAPAAKQPATPAPTTPPTTPPAMPAATGAPAATPAAEGTIRAMNLSFTVPEGWKQMPPSNSMRLAEAVVPDPSGDPAKACVAAFSSAGGAVESNITRWAAQVQDAEGKPATPTVTKRTAAGMPATVAEITGSYIGMGDAPKANWMVRGAIIETPQGLLFIKMTGPAEAMAAAGPGFNALLDSAKVP